MSEYCSYYSISYLKEIGVARVSYKKNTGKPITIEDYVNNFYKGFPVDDDERDYVKEFFKTPKVHGGFYFNKRGNRLYIIMRSQPNMDFLSVTVVINLTTEQKIALAKDIIAKTVFK